MPETPAEIIARFRCSGPRLAGIQPCEACQGHAEQSVAALTAQGKAIVDRDDLDAYVYRGKNLPREVLALNNLRAVLSGTAPQPSGTLQDAQTSGDGMKGCLAHADGSTGLSDVHMEIADRHGTRRITFPDATPGERAALMHAVELDDLRTELETARIGQRRAKETEAALARVVKLAHDLAADQLVAADNIAAAILNLDQRSLRPGDAIAALTEEPLAVRDTELERVSGYAARMEEMVIERDREATQWAERLHRAEAAISRVREVHDVHSCDRDGHIQRRTPNPCVNDGFCSCGRRAPCPTLEALDPPEFELIELTHEEWEAARDNDLAKLGCTLEALQEMARTGDYATPGHRALWLAIKPVPREEPRATL